MLAAITLLPALLGLIGSRIKPARARRGDRGLFVSVSRFARRRPIAVVLVGAAVLLLAGTPFLGVRYADARSPRACHGRSGSSRWRRLCCCSCSPARS